MVRAIIELAQALEIRCIAEGVETEDQFYILRDMRLTTVPKGDPLVLSRVIIESSRGFWVEVEWSVIGRRCGVATSSNTVGVESGVDLRQT